MENIAHKGRIVSITPQFTTVEIVSESACSSCHAASLCGMSEYTNKAIEVPTRAWDSYEVGQEVNVVLKASMGHKAVWLAYVVPLFVMIAVLMGLLAAGAGELMAGLTGIAAIGVYYLIIWLLRGRLRNEYVFEINN
ncbi:MAG: SoxR reducing system RseC family protein [Bacteroidia bacterium]|nr:SoxR reducing system RseC family protein [Bacteroidia bacterium]